MGKGMQEVKVKIIYTDFYCMPQCHLGGQLTLTIYSSGQT